MNRYNRYWMFAILLTGCSTFQKPSFFYDKNEATKTMHREVLDQLSGNFHREPASALNELKVEFKDLNKVNPGRFEVYVFPKVSSAVNKSIQKDDEHLGPPRAFEVSILAINPCNQFIEKGLFAKLQPKEAFPRELAVNSQRQCGILEIKDKKLATVDKALLRPDDQLAVRLFLDDTYRVHAVDTILFESRNKDRVVRRIYEGEYLGSGLSFFPMDLPTAQSKFANTELEARFSKNLDPIAKFQIKKRHSKTFVAPKCDGAVFTSKDLLGGKSEIGWCRGVPWPSYGTNSRYFSVTQPLRVR